MFIDLDGIQATHSAVPRFACAQCDMLLCAACRSPWHEGFSCEEFKNLPEDVRRPEDLEAILLAEKEGWKQCSQCKSIVSISSGCNHMTCR
jgi:hypothetical protein